MGRRRHQDPEYNYIGVDSELQATMCPNTIPGIDVIPKVAKGTSAIPGPWTSEAIIVPKSSITVLRQSSSRSQSISWDSKALERPNVIRTTMDHAFDDGAGGCGVRARAASPHSFTRGDSDYSKFFLHSDRL